MSTSEMESTQSVVKRHFKKDIRHEPAGTSSLYGHMGYSPSIAPSPGSRTSLPIIKKETVVERAEREAEEAIQASLLSPEKEDLMSLDQFISSTTSSSSSEQTDSPGSIFEYTPIQLIYSLTNGVPKITNIFNGTTDPHLSCSITGNSAHFIFYDSDYNFTLKPGITSVRGCKTTMQLAVTDPNRSVRIIDPSSSSSFSSSMSTS
jgi:hypothetical protein